MKGDPYASSPSTWTPGAPFHPLTSPVPLCRSPQDESFKSDMLSRISRVSYLPHLHLPSPPVSIRPRDELAQIWAGVNRSSLGHFRIATVAPACSRLRLLSQSHTQDESFKAEVLSRTPLKRIGQPEEVAGGCGWACGPAVLHSR